MTHKRCASEAGCAYYYNNENFTVNVCEVCSGQLCNNAPIASAPISLTGLLTFLYSIYINWHFPLTHKIILVGLLFELFLSFKMKFGYLFLFCTISCYLIEVADSRTVKKCYVCNHCEITRQLKKVCSQERETRCLKFRGFDITSKIVFLLKSWGFLSHKLHFIVSTTEAVTHKKCSTPTGCSYFTHSKNFTVMTCDVCQGSLCNQAAYLDAPRIFVGFLGFLVVVSSPILIA